MSMSTCVMGIRPPDDEWKKRVAAWKACKEAYLDPPQELEEYFDNLNCYDPEEDQGPLISLGDEPYCKKYNSEGASGFEIEIAKLPKGLTHIRFFNSW